MANESTLVDKIATVVEEVTFPKTLPPTEGSKLLELREAGIVSGEGATHVKPPTIKATSGFDRHFIGTKAPTIELPCFGFPQGLVPTLLKAALGANTPAQQSSPDTGTYLHQIRVAEALAYGRSKGITAQYKLATGKVFDLVDGAVDRFTMEHGPNQELFLNFFLEGRLIQASAASLAALTAPVQPPLKFSQLTFKVGGTTREIKDVTFEFNNNLKKDLFVNSDKRKAFPRGGHKEVSGAFTFSEVDSIVYGIYDNWLAGTGAEIIALYEGVLVETNFKYTIQFKFPTVKYAFENTPGSGGADVPEGPVPFVALESTTQKELEIDIYNNEATI